MKKCTFWNPTTSSCMLKDEYKPDCTDCTFYKSEEEADENRKKSAMRLSKLPYYQRERIFDNYYRVLNELEQKKYYLHLWWRNEKH